MSTDDTIKQLAAITETSGMAAGMMADIRAQVIVSAAIRDATPQQARVAVMSTYLDLCVLTGAPKEMVAKHLRDLADHIDQVYANAPSAKEKKGPR